MTTKAMDRDTEERTPMSAPLSNAPPGWLTTDEVASIAGCSPDTVIRAIKLRMITDARQTSAGTWLINRDEGIHWAENYRPYEGLRKRE